MSKALRNISEGAPKDLAHETGNRKILLIRHGMTAGNWDHRYIGATDEPLCPEGEAMLAGIRIPFIPDQVFASPMKRCVQTARILFPDREPITIPELREMNFGVFENRCFRGDLEFDPRYRQWLDTRCEGPVPEGEDKAFFTKRCLEGFCKVLELADKQSPVRRDTIALVIHGGTIMSILSRYAQPAGEYYSFQVENGRGYCGVWDGEYIYDLQKS